MSLPADILHAESHSLWSTRRLWSLWEMINFGLGEFIIALRYLEMISRDIQRISDENPDIEISDKDIDRIKTAVKSASRVINALKLSEPNLTLRRINSMIEPPIYRTYRDAYNLLDRLIADIRSGAGKRIFFPLSARTCIAIQRN